MTFTSQDFDDFLRVLDLHPEWQEALRRRLVASDFARLTETIQSLAVAQARTELRLDDLIKHTDDLFATLTAQLEQLTSEVRELVEAQKRTERSLDALRIAFDEHQAKSNDMRGILLEWRYDRHAAGYFGSVMRGARSFFPVELEDEVEAAATHKELLDFLRIDLLVRGRTRRPEPQEIWLAVEVSGNVELNDVVRAVRRADILRRTNRLVIPAVAGEQANEEVQDEVRRQHAVMFLNGPVINWPEALPAA